MTHIQTVLLPRSQPHAVLGELRAGSRFSALCDDAIESRSGALASIVDALVADGVKIIWVGNPLRSPLTVERFFLQAAGPDIDVRLERDPALLARALDDADAASRLLVIQQPESMDQELRDLLAAMASRLTKVQFLFCGTAAFRPLIVRPNNTLPIVHPRPDPADAPARRELLPAILLVLLLCLAAASLTISPHAPGPDLRQAVAAEPAQDITAATPSATVLPAPPTPIVSTPVHHAASAPVVNLQSLRQEFDHYLASRSPRLATLSAAQRDALFQQYIRSRGIDPGNGE